MQIDMHAYTRAEFQAHVEGLTFKNWSPTHDKPIGVTLHNTYLPTLAQWVENGPDHDKRIQGLKSIYEGKGWHAGPHAFISRNFINGFSPLTQWGVHASCFNRTHLGFEMCGDYEKEDFNSGDGALVRDNAVFATAVVMKKLGLTPEHDLNFHRQCTADHHPCPGKNVVSTDVIARVRAAMNDLSSATDAPSTAPVRLKVATPDKGGIPFLSVPGIAGVEKGHLPDGTTVLSLATSAGYTQVQSPAGFVGWVPSDALLPA